MVADDKTILNMLRSMLRTKYLQRVSVAEAIATTIYLWVDVPLRVSSSRHQMKYGADEPSVTPIRMFGCIAHAHVLEQRKKLVGRDEKASSLDKDIRRKTCQRYVFWQWRWWIREIEGHDNQSHPRNPAPSTSAASSSEGSSWRSSKNKKPQRSVRHDKR